MSVVVRCWGFPLKKSLYREVGFSLNRVSRGRLDIPQGVSSGPSHVLIGVLQQLDEVRDGVLRLRTDIAQGVSGDPSHALTGVLQQLNELRDNVLRRRTDLAKASAAAKRTPSLGSFSSSMR